jgi:nucleoside 2-deoxyribosyltransferase
MKDLYLTAALTNEWNIKFNPMLGGALEIRGITCYLPHRDTKQKEKDKLEVFRQDIKGIDSSRLLLAVAFDESPNWGAEIGYAYGRQKPVIIVADKEHKIPLICNGMAAEIILVESLENIEAYIELLSGRLKSILFNFYAEP